MRMLCWLIHLYTYYIERTSFYLIENSNNDSLELLWLACANTYVGESLGIPFKDQHIAFRNTNLLRQHLLDMKVLDFVPLLCPSIFDVTFVGPVQQRVVLSFSTHIRRAFMDYIGH
jgi:hypothetical protein